MDKSIFRPIHSQPIANPHLQPKSVRQSGTAVFNEALKEAINGTNKLQISKHASLRLSQRGIKIDETKWGRIEEKVNEARKLGVKESLVLLNDAALIVSAKNNTVITAMDRKEATEQVFTNINGTIILE